MKKSGLGFFFFHSLLLTLLRGKKALDFGFFNFLLHAHTTDDFAGARKNREVLTYWQLNIKSKATDDIGENTTTGYQQYLSGVLHNYL